MNKFPMVQAYAFAQANGLKAEANAIRSERLFKWKFGTSVRRGQLVRLMREHGLIDKFSLAVYPDLALNQAEESLSHYSHLLEEYEALFGNKVPPIKPPDLGDESAKFALESHLRDFLAKNLDLLEPGLRLYNENGRNGIEYPIDGGRIDILAIDREGRPVVIELKLSLGRNRVLGQILYYMGWIDQNLQSGPCRGIIVANDISEDLMTAIQRVSGITLAKYKLSFGVETVKKVD